MPRCAYICVHIATGTQDNLSARHAHAQTEEQDLLRNGLYPCHAEFDSQYSGAVAAAFHLCLVSLLSQRTCSGLRYVCCSIQALQKLVPPPADRRKWGGKVVLKRVWNEAESAHLGANPDPNVCSRQSAHEETQVKSGLQSCLGKSILTTEASPASKRKRGAGWR